MNVDFFRLRFVTLAGGREREAGGERCDADGGEDGETGLTVHVCSLLVGREHQQGAGQPEVREKSRVRRPARPQRVAPRPRERVPI